MNVILVLVAMASLSHSVQAQYPIVVTQPVRCSPSASVGGLVLVGTRSREGQDRMSAVVREEWSLRRPPGDAADGTSLWRTEREWRLFSRTPGTAVSKVGWRDGRAVVVIAWAEARGDALVVFCVDVFEDALSSADGARPALATSHHEQPMSLLFDITDILIGDTTVAVTTRDLRSTRVVQYDSAGSWWEGTMAPGDPDAVQHHSRPLPVP